MILRARGRDIRFPRRPLIMGIVNLNTDSFSGDGDLDMGRALEKAARMVAEGADCIDVGGESARTNRGAIGEREEIARVTPFLERFGRMVAAGELRPRDAVQVFPPLVSVNTWRTPVADALLAMGGDLLNDMGALPDDANARVAARHGAALLIMHSVGLPKVPHTHVCWPDIMAELDRFFAEKIALAVEAGLPREAIVLDPGIDFAKQREDNLRLLGGLERLNRFGRPVLLPVSRKTVIGEVLDLPDPRERDAGTVACLVRGLLAGAALFRVHNVRAAYEAAVICGAVSGVHPLRNVG